MCDPEKVATANSPLRGMGASCPADCGRKGAATAVVGAPFYGMVLAQMALEGLPDMIMVRVGGLPLGQGCVVVNV